MRSIGSWSAFLVVYVLTVGIAVAAAQLATGTPRFGSFGGGPFDTVNLGNLNVHFDIPVMSKAGRGLPFTYTLSYDSAVWYPVGVSGNQNWQNVGKWGWRGNTEVAVGYISYSITQTSDCNGQGIRTTYSNWTYHDTFGVAHVFSGTTYTVNGPASCNPGPPLTTTAPDGSGYTLHANGSNGTITAASGEVIAAPINASAGAGTVTDANGNRMSVNSSGQFFDTLSNTTPVLTASGQGTQASPTTFTYTSPANTNVSYVMHFTNKTVRTYFQCSLINDFGPIANVPLVSDITLPDSTKYIFTYEASNDPNNPGSVTGRIDTVTLPTGGTVTYHYSGGTNGINCADGAPVTLTRIVNPGGTWIYTRSGTAPAFTTTISDPATPMNQTEIKFQGIYETQRKVFQGSTSGTLLRTTLTCYNGNGVGTPTSCATLAVNLPISRTSVFTYLPDSTGLQAETNTVYGNFGLLNEVDEYDYGSSGSVGSLIRKTITTYAGLGNGVVDRPASVVVQDGNSVVKASTSYGYDESSVVASGVTQQHISITGSRGNLTSINAKANGTTNLYRKFTYYDTGSISTSTAVSTSSSTNGAATTYNYAAGAASCNNAFVTSISEPLLLSRSMTWNCTGGVLLSATDENSKVASASYTDSFFWRPASTTDQAGNVTSFSYLSPTRTESTMTFNAGASVVDHLVQLDGLGRQIVSQTRQAPGSSNYDSVETDYNLVGQISKLTLPYIGTAGALCSGACPGTTTAYDALGRLLSVADAGGGSVGYSYPKNDMLQTLGPAPTGENAKQKQSQYDAVGRLTSVCEVTSGTTPFPGGPCGQSSPQTGYLTTYTYDTSPNLNSVTVKQNAQGTFQTRTYIADMLGRMTTEANPESGTKSYGYDSDATCGSSSGDLVKTGDAVGNITCHVYDALHRMTNTTYPSGSYAGATDKKFFVYDTAVVNGVTMQNAKGRLAEAYTCPSTGVCTPKKTDVGLSYSARGEVADEYQAAGDVGIYFHSAATYWANGAVKTMGLYDASGASLIPLQTYGADGEGRWSSVSAASGQSPVSSAVYDLVNHKTTVTYGSLDSDVFTFDANTGRMNRYDYNVASQTVTGNLTWNANGSLNTLAITDPLNSLNAQTCNYTHDDLSRTKTANCGTKWNQSFSFDPFGNINKTATVGTSFTPTYNLATNRIQALSNCAVIYDANGNPLQDCGRGIQDSYTWNADGKPVNVDGETIVYDALGRGAEAYSAVYHLPIVYTPTGEKLGQVVNSSGTTYLYRGYVPLPGGGKAVYVSSGLSFYLHPDWLGSGRLETTPSRSVYQDVAYAPYGENYSQSGATYDLSFTGQTQDEVSVTYDFLYRDYSAISGRWYSPDPAGLAAVNFADPQSWNRYSYVSNNPLNAIDPLGLCNSGLVGMDTWDATTNTLSVSVPCLSLEFDEMYLAQWGNLGGTRSNGGGGGGGGAGQGGSGPANAANNDSWAWTFTKSFFGGFTIDTGSDSCLAVALDSYKPVVNAFKKTQDYSKNYVAPIVTSLPGAGASIANGLYSTVQYGADRGNALEMGGAISATATFLAAQGQRAVSAVASAGRNPYVALTVVDAALLWGVGNEAVAAYQGKCH